MTLPAYPTTLPVPMQEGYQVGSVDPLTRTEMESGPPYARRRQLTLFVPVAVRCIMSKAQSEILWQFWRVTLNTGASQFTMPIYTLRSDTPQTYDCMWQGGSPTFTPYQDSDEVLASFEVKANM